jgi:hypothetical protein
MALGVGCRHQAGEAATAQAALGSVFVPPRDICDGGWPAETDPAAWRAAWPAPNLPTSLWNGGRGVVVMRGQGDNISYYGIDTFTPAVVFRMYGTQSEASALEWMDGSCRPNASGTVSFSTQSANNALPGQGDQGGQSNVGSGEIPNLALALCLFTRGLLDEAERLEQTCVYGAKCSERGASCGSVADGFGGQYDCGTCGAGQWCNQDNRCVAAPISIFPF